MATREVYERTFDEDELLTDSSTNPCPECTGQVLNDGQETVCVNCGLVLGEYRIDHGPEWYPRRENENSQRRTGAPRTPTRHDHGLSTEIGRYRDGAGRVLSSRTRRHLGRLRRYHSQAHCSTSREQNLRVGLVEICRLAAGLDLSFTIRDQACVLFRRAQHASLLVGRSIESMAAACVYAVCRCNDVIRTPLEIAHVSSVDAQTIQKRFAVLNVELGLKTVPPRPRSYVSMFATALNTSRATRVRATELVLRVEAAEQHVGRNPRGVAAACLYVAMQEANLLTTQSAVAEVAGVSAATIRMRCDEIQALLAV